MTEHKHKRWQNLIFGKCPVCNGKLKGIKEMATIYPCQEKGCDFAISAKKYVEILLDENHILRRFLTIREKELLAKASSELRNFGYDEFSPLDKVSGCDNVE